MSCVKARSHHFLLKECSVKNEKGSFHWWTSCSHCLWLSSGVCHSSYMWQWSYCPVYYLIYQSWWTRFTSKLLVPALLNTYPVHILIPQSHTSASPVIFFIERMSWFAKDTKLSLWPLKALDEDIWWPGFQGVLAMLKRWLWVEPRWHLW